MAVVPGRFDNIHSDDFEEVNKYLAVVVKRRKTIPTKCLEISSQITALEFRKLENAKILLEETVEKKEFKKVIQELKTLKSFQFTLEDLNEAEKKLKQNFKLTKDINSYLEKRRKLVR